MISEPPDPTGPNDPTQPQPLPQPPPRQNKPNPPATPTTPQGPMSVGIINTGSGDYSTAFTRLQQALGSETTIGSASLTEPLGRFEVVVLVSSWADTDYAAVRAASKALTDYVSAGGGLFMFQPNPSHFPGEHLRVDILPAWFEVENRYTDSSVEIADTTHPVVSGLSAEDMPYPADRISSASPEWKILARGAQSRQGSLAVAEIGDGRVALDTDNPATSGRVAQAMPGQSDRLLVRVFDWLRHR